MHQPLKKEQASRAKRIKQDSNLCTLLTIIIRSLSDQIMCYFIMQYPSLQHNPPSQLAMPTWLEEEIVTLRTESPKIFLNY